MTMAKAKNVTFTLPVELVEKYRAYAAQDMIASLNAGVKEALEEYSVRLDKEVLRREMKKAAADPLFLQDSLDTMNAFESADAEQARGLKEW
jgi:hypothetical protein